MKKLLLFTTAIFICNLSILTAQTEKGKFAVGISSTFGLMGTGSDAMSIGQSTVKYKSDASGFEEPDPDKMTSFNFVPKARLFVADNLLIGVDIALAYSKTKDGVDDYSYSSSIISAGPYLRYYIPTNSIKPFLEFTSSFGTYKTKYEDDLTDDELSSSLTALGGGIGMAVPIGSKATFDVLAHYSSLRIEQNENNEDKNRSVIGTIGLKLGFVVFLGK